MIRSTRHTQVTGGSGMWRMNSVPAQHWLEMYDFINIFVLVWTESIGNEGKDTVLWETCVELKQHDFKWALHVFSPTPAMVQKV